MTRLTFVDLFHRRQVRQFTYLSILALLAAALLFCRTPDAHAQAAERAKVAEGEYLIHAGSPDDKPGVLRDLWALWRIGEGKYVVESELHFERSGDEPDIIDRTVNLSSDFRLSETKTISRTSNPGYQVDIQIAGDEIRVTHPTAQMTKHLWGARDFYDPLSPWTWSALARSVRPVKSPGTPLNFSIVDIDGPDATIGIAESWGRVQCLGAEQLETAGQKFNATKYVLHLGMYPGFFVWLSEDGLVLASQNEEEPAQKTELVKLKKSEELPTLVDPNARKNPPHKP